MSRTVALLALCVLVVLAGCVGPQGCPPMLDVDRATTVPADAEVVSYDSLSSDEKEVFDDALEADSMVSLEDRPWNVETQYIEKDGTVYWAGVAVC